MNGQLLRLAQNGVTGMSGIAAISAAKPRCLPVGISSAFEDMSPNDNFTPVPVRPCGTKIALLPRRLCRQFSRFAHSHSYHSYHSSHVPLMKIKK
jgi:hypothetical protein